MKNLKRALSLALASVMVLGLMMVGASAKSFDDFSDKDKIVNAEAVSILNNLNVINGKDDGSFDPTGIVTRAEMAKMICVVLNGGKDPQLGTVSSNTYSDTAGNWAAAYIEYCTQLKIVAGDGTGKFNPTNTVTGAEAAKMLLVALGYDSGIAGFTGGQWATAVNVKANGKGLYDGLNINPSEGLTRDNAAQMVYNAINATMVTYDYTLTTDGDKLNSVTVEIDKTDSDKNKISLLNDKFGAYRIEGVVTANEYAKLGNNYATQALKAGETTITRTNDDELGDMFSGGNFQVSSGAAELGRAVILYAKPSTAAPSSANKATVIGSLIVDTANNVVVVDTGDDKLADVADDNNLDLIASGDDATKYFSNVAQTDATTGIERILIDNDADGEVEYVIYNTHYFGKVTKLSTSGDGSITVKTSAGNKTYDDKADVVGFDDVEKDQFVNAIEVGGKLYVEKAESVTGELTAYKEGSSLTVDGTKYTTSDLKTFSDSSLTNSFPGDPANGYDNLDNEATFFLDKFGYIVAVGEADEGSSNYALVIGFDAGTNIRSAEAKIAMADGTVSTYKVDKLKDSTGASLTINSTNAPADGTIMTYSINSDDELNLQFINSGDVKDTASGAYKFTKGQAQLTSGTVNYNTTTSTVFFYVDTDDWSVDVFTGRGNAGSIDETSGIKSSVVLKSGSSKEVKAVAVFDASAASTGDYLYLYNYIGKTSDGAEFAAIIDGERFDGKKDNEDQPTIVVDDSGFNKNSYGLYTYSVNSDGTYNLDKQDTAINNTKMGVVTFVDGDNIMVKDALKEENFVITKDSVVALIDGGDTALDESVEEGDYVILVYDDSDVEALFIREAYDDADLSLSVKDAFDSTTAKLTIAIDEDTITLGGTNKLTTSLDDLKNYVEAGSEDAVITTDAASATTDLEAGDKVIVTIKNTSKTYTVAIEAS